MQFRHAPAAVSAAFDDPNFESAVGLVPMLRRARSAGLDELAQARLSVPTDKGSYAGAKVMSLIAGMLAGADSIDDMKMFGLGPGDTLLLMADRERGIAFVDPAVYAGVVNKVLGVDH